MSEKDDQQLTSISGARTLEEIADFWDTHSLDDYWDQTHEVEFTVRAKRRRRITLAPDVAQAFPSDEAVNEALRLVMRIAEVPSKYSAEPASN